ncbi:unnamed protein product, partial [Musa acuminata subsp. burmannicoides]
ELEPLPSLKSSIAAVPRRLLKIAPGSSAARSGGSPDGGTCDDIVSHEIESCMKSCVR